MDLGDFIGFLPINSVNSDNQNITRNLSSLVSLAGLSQQPPSYFKIDKHIDPSTLNIKEFSDNFRLIKSKLSEIEIIITTREEKRDEINKIYDEVITHLTEFFNIDEGNCLIDILKNKAYNMIMNLELDKFYEERSKLLEYYKVAVPLLNQVKEEFFKDKKIETCHICYDKPVSYCIMPCGHVLCEDCRKKVIGTCYLCRTPVVKMSRIYI